jgi:intracellular multiplication protein IcmK
MYLRTSLTVLSPSWIGIMPSADGTNAYEMQQSSDVLVSKDGKPFLLKIEGF